MTNKTQNKKNQSGKNEHRGSKSKIPIIVFAIISVCYLILFFVNHTLFIKSFNRFVELVTQITPFLIIVFVIMFLNFLFIKPATIKKHLGEESGFKGYLYAIISGIISVGSVYMWYPLLKELRDSGMSNKLVAVFIYNRSIKLHLLPVMILYFGLKFTIILTITSIFYSFAIAFIIQKFTSENYLKK